MTCIAARRKPLELGGDSAVTDDGGTLVRTREPKVWRIADGFIGEAGSTLWREALRGIRWPAKLNAEWLRDQLPKVVRARVQQIIGEDKSIDGECLIAAPCGLWSCESDGALLELAEPYAAIGSGAPYALGALHAGASVKQALKAAAHHEQGVRAPFHVLRIESKHAAAP